MYDLDDQQQQMADMAYDFGQAQIAPHALSWEADGIIPKDFWLQTGALGMGGMFVSPDRDGSGMSRADGVVLFEALSRACPSVAAFLSIHNMCAAMIDRYGSDAVKRRILPKALTMDCILSYCLTEPGSGSDAAALATRAERTNDGWQLTGTKAFISGGGYSDAYLVMCRSGGEGAKGISAMIVEDGTTGLSFGGLESKMGWRAQPTRQVQLDGCKVPTENLIGVEGDGFKYAMAALDGGRLNIAACSLGGAREALERTLTYMSERRAFGRTIDRFQALQFRLADMETRLHAARLVLLDAAQALDAGAPDATGRCAKAKLLCTDTGFEIANGCLQLFGGYGYLTEYGIEKIVRDLRVHQILEGTNEIMRVIIAREMIGERA